MSDTRSYRVSALARGFLRMWRGWRVILPVAAVNAVVQSLLVWPAFTSASGWWVALSALVSALAFGVSFGLVAATALQAVDGPVAWAAAWGALRANLASYSLWALAWLVSVAVGLALNTLPGLLVAALTPFLLLAAVDGHRNALARNLRTIGRRFWRWLVTVVIVGVLLLLGNVSAGLFTFFVRTPLAALVVWLVAGLVLAWFTTAWALIYRSAWTDPEPDAADDAASGDPAGEPAVV